VAVQQARTKPITRSPVFLLALLWIYLAPPAVALAGQPQVSRLTITDVTPLSFSVVWISSEPSTCTLLVLNEGGPLETGISFEPESKNYPPAEQLGVMKVRVSGPAIHHDTTYYFQTLTTSKADNTVTVYPEDPISVRTQQSAFPIDNFVLLQDIYFENEEYGDGSLMIVLVEGMNYPVSGWTGEYPNPSSPWAPADLNNAYSSLTHEPLEIHGGEELTIEIFGGVRGYANSVRETPPPPAGAAFVVLSPPIILNNAVPVANFTADVTRGETTLTVSFSDQSTGTIDEWYWYFGDGSTSVDQNPTHTYIDPGTYTVSLTVTGLGVSDTETKTDFINVSQPPPCQPSQGTIGTEITIYGNEFGEKKGKVLIGTSKCKVLEWTDTSISCLIKKVRRTMGPDTYDVTIRPKGKGLAPIVLEDAFSIMAPDITDVIVNGDSATIEGSFFGTKKVKAYLVVDGNGKRKKMKVIYLEMDPVTGFSQLEVKVKNKVLKKLAPGSYDVIVTNKVGSATFPNGFTK